MTCYEWVDTASMIKMNAFQILKAYQQKFQLPYTLQHSLKAYQQKWQFANDVFNLIIKKLQIFKK